MTSYTIMARLIVTMPVTVHGNTLAEAQDNFDNGKYELYIDPEAEILEASMLRITVGSQIGLDTGATPDLPLAIQAPVPEPNMIMQELI